MIKVTIKNLKLFGYHGVREEEKENGQYFLFNVEVGLSKNNFIGNDNIDSTLNYSDVIDIIKRVNQDNRFDLLETLCQAIAKEIFNFSLISSKVTVMVEKPSSPIKEKLESVGVEYIADRKYVELEKSIVYLSVGSNILNRENNLRKAVQMIKKNPYIEVTKVSSIYETEPMYVQNQESFYNIIVKADLKNELNPFSMLGFLKKIEFDMGRKKTSKRYGPRIIDIDILYYGDLKIKSNFLTIPHPKIKERKFVLVPLNEISSDLKIEKKPIEEFINYSNLSQKVKIIKKWQK